MRWTEPALACEGMSRPDGRGLRLRFAGPRAGGELAVVFAAPELGAGASGKTIPVNVTLLDGAGERIYGTQGDSRCAFDEVEQQLLESAALPPRSYRVSARGFCTAPARAMDGNGAVFVTRFDFAGLVSLGADGGAPRPQPDLFPALERTELKAKTAGGSHRFTAWIADDDGTRARGLMYVRELPPDTGMLFVFEQPQFASFWMKNTYLSLDLIFIARGRDGGERRGGRQAPLPRSHRIGRAGPLRAGARGRYGIENRPQGRRPDYLQSFCTAIERPPLPVVRRRPRPLLPCSNKNA